MTIDEIRKKFEVRNTKRFCTRGSVLLRAAIVQDLRKPRPGLRCANWAQRAPQESSADMLSAVSQTCGLPGAQMKRASETVLTTRIRRGLSGYVDGSASARYSGQNRCPSQ